MRAGVGAGDQAGEKRAFEREIGGVVIEQHARRDPGGERHGEAEREHQTVGPVALLENQDVAEAAIAREHGRQRRHHGQLDDQRREQELLGGEEFGFLRASAVAPEGSRHHGHRERRPPKWYHFRL